MSGLNRVSDSTGCSPTRDHKKSIAPPWLGSVTNGGNVKTVFAVLALALLSACAPMTHRVDVDPVAVEQEAKFQRELALESLITDSARLYRVSYPLLRAAQDLCKDNRRNVLGIYALNRQMLGKLADAAGSQGLHDELKLIMVAEQSPAFAAGLRVGDVISSINGNPAAARPKNAEQLADTWASLAENRAPLEFKVRRGAASHVFTVTPESTCGQTVIPSDETIVNAFADGKRVIITRGMLRFATSDTELALVIAHEIAHNAMKHLDAKMGNQLIGAILDGVIAGLTRTHSTGLFTQVGAQAFSQEFEAEADYVGLYILARAGVPIKEAPLFWRRMAAQSPGRISNTHAASHPATSYRMVALSKAAAEIENKRASGLALMPRMKDSTEVATPATAKPPAVAVVPTKTLPPAVALTPGKPAEAVVSPTQTTDIAAPVATAITPTVVSAPVAIEAPPPVSVVEQPTPRSVSTRIAPTAATPSILCDGGVCTMQMR